MSSRFHFCGVCLVLGLVANLANAEPPKTKDGPLGMKFVALSKGITYLGAGWSTDTRFKTRIDDDFEIAIHTVTQGQWISVMGKNSSFFTHENMTKQANFKDVFGDLLKDFKDEDLKQFPVEGVSWADCQEFLKKLNEREKGKGYFYRLPQEIEWEYACRGGATTLKECCYSFYFAKPTNELTSKDANFNGIFSGDFPQRENKNGAYLKRTTKVGSYAPNSLGLYDMHGNVCQWCSDIFHPQEKGVTGVSRVVRGSSFICRANECSADQRTPVSEDSRDVVQLSVCGLRLVRVLSTAVVKSPAVNPKAGLKSDLAKTDFPKPKEGPLGMKFVRLPKGTTYLGWTGEIGTAKKTEIKADFEIAVCTVTQSQWETVMGDNPSWFSRNGEGNGRVKFLKDEELKQLPVENVSWDDCQEFVKKLNAKEKGKGYVYRLPSRNEWEYAYRCGANSEVECSCFFYFLKPMNDITLEDANCIAIPLSGDEQLESSWGRPTKVGSYPPNKLGLYDMVGNVAQWCEDQAGKEAMAREIIGCCWRDISLIFKVRMHYPVSVTQKSDNIGFRLVRVPSVPEGK